MRYHLIAAVAFASISASSASAIACQTISALELRERSDRAYALILEGAVKAGRIYSREATASGARRHYQELRARYIDAGFQIVEPDVLSD
jgi:hypothetical protein